MSKVFVVKICLKVWGRSKNGGSEPKEPRAPTTPIFFNSCSFGSTRWVAGPNRQFQKMMRWVMENIPNAVVFMKEFDTIPQMDNHFGNLMDEINENQPFYMLGR